MEKQIVYRFLTKNEFDCWVAGDKNGISSPYHEDSWPAGNNHQYIEGVCYVHFYEKLLDASIVMNMVQTGADYLCKFEIDKCVLDQHKSYGKYLDDVNDCVQINEYAVPLDKIDASCLKEYRIVKSEKDIKYIDVKFGWEKVVAKANTFEI